MRIARVGLMLSALTPVYAGLVGCERGEAVIPRGGRGAIEQLVSERSPAAMRGLLASNGVAPPGEFLLRAPIPWGSRSAAEDGSVSSPSRVTSLGEKFVAAALCRSSGWRGQAVIFDEDGMLLKSFGNAADEPSVQEMAQVLSLGSEDSWFVQLDTPVVTSEPGQFDMDTKVYYIKTGFPLMMSVRRFNNGMAFTRTPREAKEGSYYSLSDPKRTRSPAEGSDANGNPSLAFIRWDATRHRFYGPSSVSSNGHLVYQVSLKESVGFDPTDPVR